MHKATLLTNLLLLVLIFFSPNISADDIVIAPLMISKPTFVTTPPMVSVELSEAAYSNDEKNLLSDEDISLIALITMAEAEGECEYGKRLVIDTILNRMDSEYFPDSVYDVIYQQGQFAPIWNGRIDRCQVKEDICELVKEELRFRTNTDVIFFAADRYSKCGVPIFQVGNHYFSRCK